MRPRLTFSVIAAAALTATLAGGVPANAGALVVTYPAPQGQPLNHDFSVQVRPTGGVWRNLDEYRATVDLDTISAATMVTFDTNGPVEVKVTASSETIHSARVRPLSYNIAPAIAADGRSATFTLPQPLKVSFEINGDIFHNLHVFANQLERDIPRKGARNVIFFGPGLHRIPGDHVLDIGSGTTVYVAGGAVVQGALNIERAHDVVVRGHGILDPGPVLTKEKMETVQVTRSSDIGIRDITILNSAEAGFFVAKSSRVTIANAKELSSGVWTDGITIMSSSDVLIDDVFFRTSDDSVSVYATRYEYLGDTRRVTVRNSTLWADVAHTILVGTHANPSRRDVIAQLVFQNLDVLEHDEDNVRYQGTMAVDAGDSVMARDIRFDSVRVEDFTEGQLMNVRVFLNPDYNTRPGTKVEHVLFRNISYNGESEGENTSVIEGYDDSRPVTDVTIEDLRRNGSLVLDAEAGGIRIGPHTSKVVIRARPPTRTMDDSDTAIRYFGRWSRQAATDLAGGSAQATSTLGSRLSLSFAGTEARAYGLTSPSTGKADVYVDGAYATTVDTFSTRRRAQQVLFDTGVLSAGRHTVELRYRGQRDRLANGAAVQVDKFEVVS